MAGLLGPKKKLSPFAQVSQDLNEGKASAPTLLLPPHQSIISPSIHAPAPPPPAQFPVRDAGEGKSPSQMQYFEIDWRTLNLRGDSYTSADIGGRATLLNELRGDWLYVSPDSTLPVQADFLSRTTIDYPSSLTLAPGFVYRQKFDAIMAYCKAAGLAQVGTTPPAPYPVLRVFFGVGVCPFEDSAGFRGANLLGGAAPVLTGNITWTQLYTVTPGMLIEADVVIVKTVNAGNSFFFDGALLLYNSLIVALGSVVPYGVGGLQSNNSVPLTIGAIASYHWAPLVVPRGVAYAQIQVRDFGTAAFPWSGGSTMRAS
ncbi:MAG: hypothetical protein ACREUQ_07400 [Burkholderiales bacterium]